MRARQSKPRYVGIPLSVVVTASWAAVVAYGTFQLAKWSLLEFAYVFL
jgi:hypothetical protein